MPLVGLFFSCCYVVIVIRVTVSVMFIPLIKRKIKKAREQHSCLSRYVRPSHCLLVQNKQCRSPRVMVYSETLYANHGRGTLRYCGTNVEVAKFNIATDKRSYNVFFLCPAVSSRGVAPLTLPFALDGHWWCRNDDAKVHFFSDMANFLQRKKTKIVADEIILSTTIPKRWRPFQKRSYIRYVIGEAFILFGDDIVLLYRRPR